MKYSQHTWRLSAGLLVLLSSAQIWAQEAAAPEAAAPEAAAPEAAAPEAAAPEAAAPEAAAPEAAAPEAAAPEAAAPEAAVPPSVEPVAGVPPKEELPAAEPPALTGPSAAPQPAATEPPALTGPGVATEPVATQKPKVVTPEQYDDDYEDSLGLSKSLLAKPDPKFQIGLGLDMSFPVGEAADFASGFSFQGFSIDVRYLGFDELQIGAMIAWHTMSNKLTDTIDEGPATLTGTMVRELSVTPMVAKVTYARLNKDGAIPYVSFGAGGARVLRRVDIGIARILDENWQWAMIPEVGVMLPVGPVLLMGAFRYNLLIAGSGQPTTQYLNFVLGLGLK